MSTEMRRFLSASRWAVVGASSDPAKWSNKVLRWYTARGKPVTPVNPNVADIEGIQTVADVVGIEERPSLPHLTWEQSQLDDLPDTSISTIINPKAGLPILKTLFERPAAQWPRAVWLQPGAYDDQIRQYLSSRGAEDRVVPYGECILVSGDGILRDLQTSSL